jgi:hypothetical protein
MLSYHPSLMPLCKAWMLFGIQTAHASPLPNLTALQTLSLAHGVAHLKGLEECIHQRYEVLHNALHWH